MPFNLCALNHSTVQQISIIKVILINSSCSWIFNLFGNAYTKWLRLVFVPILNGTSAVTAFGVCNISHLIISQIWFVKYKYTTVQHFWSPNFPSHYRLSFPKLLGKRWKNPQNGLKKKKCRTFLKMTKKTLCST